MRLRPTLSACFHHHPPLDGSNSISFSELLSGLSTILHGTMEERIGIMFACYDLCVVGTLCVVCVGAEQMMLCVRAGNLFHSSSFCTHVWDLACVWEPVDLFVLGKGEDCVDTCSVCFGGGGLFLIKENKRCDLKPPPPPFSFPSRPTPLLQERGRLHFL